MFKEYDVIVVGAGHAGCEAAAAAANLGSSVLLITMNMETIAQMSCNPAMGGVAKGQIVREIDAMGGYSGIIADKTTLQFRMLNKSKGPAMWSPRAVSYTHLGKIYNYNGNYAFFLEKKSEREASDESTFQKNKNLLKKELEWMRRMPAARTVKSQSRICLLYTSRCV